MCRGLVLVMILCVPQAGAAQTTTLGRSAEIKGQVYVARDVPAPTGALVQLERSDSGMVGNTQTDSNGKFEFHGLAPGAYILRIGFTGYKTHEEYLDLTLNTHPYVIVTLQAIPREMEKLPPPEAGNAVSARDAAIPAEAVKEFEKGKKLLVEKKDAGGGASHFQKAIKLYENFPQAYILLGVALGAQQKFQEAEDAYTHAIKLDEHMADAYLGLGTLLNQQKRFADAEHALARAVELKPESFEAHYELGKSLWALQRNADAEPQARAAVTLKPGSAEAHLLMGNILLRQHDRAGAVLEFKESLRAEPNNPYAEATRKMIKQLEDFSRRGP